jgi:hypothetical protein
MKRALLYFLLFSGLVLIPVAAYVQDTLIKDTAVFDRAFIPALFLTGQGKVEQSRMAMEFLKEGWSEYKGRYYGAQPTDAGWIEDMEKVEGYIMAADRFVAGGKDLSKAHEELEGVRGLMMEARKRNRIEYFPDRLTEFHRYMEEIFDAAAKKEPETLSDKNMEIIRNNLPKAIASWEAARTDEFDAQVFGFDSEKIRKMKQLHKAEEDALSALQEALNKGDKAEMIKHATSLKGKFIPVYLLFGDFERLKK